VSSAQERFPEFVEDQREFFDNLITEDWATYVSPDWDESRRHEVDAILSRVTAQRILDVGCGCGFHDVEMAHWPGVVEVVGIDNSERSIAVANREYRHRNVRRVVADIRDYRGSPFDLVVSFQVIEHLSWPVEFLEGCVRNLRPQGIVALVTPSGDRLDNRLRRLFRKECHLLDPQHYREYSPAALRGLAAPLPLEPIATVGLHAGMHVPGLGLQVVPPILGRFLATRWPGISSSFAQLWRYLPSTASIERS
jgi:SAM-dependent methyltransferase